jgi:hypothetical protein
MPNPNKIFHSDDWTAIPFSLLWTGFFVFWEADALGVWSGADKHSPPSTFMVLWGIPFLLFGQYFVWGRFLFDAWLKRRTYYAVTNRRVLILQESWKRQTYFKFLEHIPEISREGTSIGTLWLGPKLPIMGGRGTLTRDMSRFYISNSVPTLADIDNVDYVHRLILDLREKSRVARNPCPSSPLLRLRT